MDSRTMTTIDGRTMTGVYVIASLVNRQNDEVDALHVDRSDRYAKKNRQKSKKKENKI